MDEQKARQHLYNGFGNGLTRAVELAATPAILGLAGYGIDRWAGIVPVFTLLFAFVAIAGVAVKMYYRYDVEMREHEAALRSAASGRARPAGARSGSVPGTRIDRVGGNAA